MCNFSEPWFGARYEDSFCIDGYLHDADNDGYDPDDRSHCCPQCNTLDFLKHIFEEAESTSSWGYGTGAHYVGGDSRDIWNNGCAWALKFNPTDAPKLIKSLGTPKFAIDQP